MSRRPGRLFSALSAAENVEMGLFIGDEVPKGRVRSGGDVTLCLAAASILMAIGAGDRLS